MIHYEPYSKTLLMCGASKSSLALLFVATQPALPRVPGAAVAPAGDVLLPPSQPWPPPALLLPPLCRALRSSLPPRTRAILSRPALLPRSCVSSGKFPNLSGRLFFQLVSLP